MSVIKAAIFWHSVHESSPEDDETVLLYDPQDEAFPVWPGYLDGEMWRTAEGMPVYPTYWAPMPGGPVQ